MTESATSDPLETPEQTRLNAITATGRPCLACGAVFLPKRPQWQKYCGTRCKNAWHRDEKKRLEAGELTRLDQLERRVAALEAALQSKPEA